MANHQDGPASYLFQPVHLERLTSIEAEIRENDDEKVIQGLRSIPVGACVFRGLPFDVHGVARVGAAPTALSTSPFTAKWLVFLHAAREGTVDRREDNIISPMKGAGLLNKPAAKYTITYADGSSSSAPISRRHEINSFSKGWGENTIRAVPHLSPAAVHQHHEQQRVADPVPVGSWGQSQTRVSYNHYLPWLNQLYAWENPHPTREITTIECRADTDEVFLFGLCAGNVETNPLRWERRKKAVIDISQFLPVGEAFDPKMDEFGRFSQIGVDLGQIISASPQNLYPDDSWESTHNNLLPELSESLVVIEYTAHRSACFHLADGTIISEVQIGESYGSTPSTMARPVAPSHHRIKIRVVETGRSVPIPVKLHIHGDSGEYLAPVDRHRIPNEGWFEDYSADFIHMPATGSVGANGLLSGRHFCAYINGETSVDVPLGTIYIEVSKGYEITPMRRRLEIDAQTDIINIELERVLNWRDRGWVTADTHVHFLSPTTALIEGAAEGVNVVNLLASQWGELMTNAGDFDGKTTWGSEEAGGDGEYLVRVGTENRQHVLGHISLLGYEGQIIAPMTVGGPDESALGDPIEVLLTEWARMCKAKNGVVIVPHFPNPRLENAAAIVDGSVDGVEMTSWGNLHLGIDPYSLSDWYRYLNCGYHVAAVGGTDKMSASTAVGTSRTYARIEKNVGFTYETWKEAIRRGETFVTYGPLVDFQVDGMPMGSAIRMSSSGGTVSIAWEVASVTIPVTEVDLVANGEIVERYRVSDWKPVIKADDTIRGEWTVPVKKSVWFALIVRGHYPEKREIIASHTSAVMVTVDGAELYVEHDALSILEQIEGSLAYIDTIGTRADEKRYKELRLVLESVHRRLHNRMHQSGHFHDHTPVADHSEHHTGGA
jgi:hypothetical protein